MDCMRQHLSVVYPKPSDLYTPIYDHLYDRKCCVCESSILFSKQVYTVQLIVIWQQDLPWLSCSAFWESDNSPVEAMTADMLQNQMQSDIVFEIIAVSMTRHDAFYRCLITNMTITMNHHHNLWEQKNTHKLTKKSNKKSFKKKNAKKEKK